MHEFGSSFWIIRSGFGNASSRLEYTDKNVLKQDGERREILFLHILIDYGM